MKLVPLPTTWSRHGSHPLKDWSLRETRRGSLWGLHMGLTQSLVAAMVTDTAPTAPRGTAFGVFNLVSGVAMLVASVLAGLLWDRFGPSGTFAAGATFSLLSLVGFACLGHGTRRPL